MNFMVEVLSVFRVGGDLGFRVRERLRFQVQGFALCVFWVSELRGC